jgi:hypothetical protein
LGAGFFAAGFLAGGFFAGAGFFAAGFLGAGFLAAGFLAAGFLAVAIHHSLEVEQIHYYLRIKRAEVCKCTSKAWHPHPVPGSEDSTINLPNPALGGRYQSSAW